MNVVNFCISHAMANTYILSDTCNKTRQKSLDIGRKMALIFCR